MLYEMVTERKAFDRDDVESLRQSVLESTPVAPIHVNPKVHPGLSDLIMKALAKDPAERYQSGQGTARRSGEMQRVEDSGGQEAGGPRERSLRPRPGRGAVEVYRRSNGQAGFRASGASCGSEGGDWRNLRKRNICGACCSIEAGSADCGSWLLQKPRLPLRVWAATVASGIRSRKLVI